jgi:hypothetical protein
MEQIMNQLFPGLGLVPDVKLSLCQAERNAFAAMVEDQKRDHLFSQLIFDLAGNGRLSIAKNSSTVHQSETVCWESAFPDFGNLQFDFGENASSRVALAAFAQDGAPNDERRFPGQLLN